MKRIIISGFILTLLFCIGLQSQAKNKMVKTYAFGFAACFNDSTVYFTDIQVLDSAWLNEKNDFLVSRDNYSYQLRDYLADHGMPNRTCIICFSPKEKKVYKKYAKLSAKYTKKGNFNVKHLTQDQFRFKCIAPNAYQTGDEEKMTKKEAKKAAKKQRKEAKGGARQPKN